jgi:glycosyltransferase involved in cell wall biosynthesis
LNRPKVSVCIITYNHEAYIAKAIESALMQKTDFPFEIRVGEDDSTDRTREIVREYDEKYDNVIGLYRDKRDKIYIDGRPTGRFNFADNLLNATGEYIAILDGDDYWIDETKLQKQVELLDANPDASFCFHRIYDETDDGQRSVFPRESRCRKKVYTTEDFIQDNFVPTASVVFRNRDFSLPEWFMQVPFGDWPLHLLNAEKGKVLFVDEIMAVRVNHGAGAWSAMQAATQDYNKIKMLCTYLDNLDPKYREQLLKRIRQTQQRILRHSSLRGGIRAVMREWKQINATSCRPMPLQAALTAMLSGGLRHLLGIRRKG